MRLGDYILQRFLDEGEEHATLEGLQNNIRCDLIDAVKTVPTEDWDAEIRIRQKVSDGQTLIWLDESSEPNYSIQECCSGTARSERSLPLFYGSFMCSLCCY